MSNIMNSEEARTIAVQSAKDLKQVLPKLLQLTTIIAPGGYADYSVHSAIKELLGDIETLNSSGKLLNTYLNRLWVGSFPNEGGENERKENDSSDLVYPDCKCWTR